MNSPKKSKEKHSYQKKDNFHSIPTGLFLFSALLSVAGALFFLYTEFPQPLFEQSQADSEISEEIAVETVTEFTISVDQEPEHEFLFYYQTDPRWKDYLCAGQDPMGTYGCGPTAMAMVVTNLTDQIITPPEMADWASQNGYYSPGNGSMHSLIPGAAEAFGLRTETLSVRTPEALRTCLESGKLIVLLMGPGHFTDGGHFILVIGTNGDGSVKIADPVNPEHTQMDWAPSLLLSELSKADDNGSPAWVISRKD